MAGQLYITEYSALGLGSTTQIPQEPPLADYRFTIGAGSTAGPQAFNVATRFVRVHCDATNAVSIAFGVHPATAAVTNQRFATNQTEYKAVPLNAGWGIAGFPNT